MTLSKTQVASPPIIDVLIQPEDLLASLHNDVARGLAADPKSLPPKWLYDERGSQLFDDITRLPEYYLTRSETEILLQRSHEIAHLSGADTVIELGSGTSTKTRLLLDAFTSTGRLRRIVMLDVSEETLRDAGEELSYSYRGAQVHAVVGDFERHLWALPRGGRRMVVFLGSTIGNLDPPARAAFLASLRTVLGVHDSLLLGTDLVKSADRLVPAYDDAAGVTAAFERNVLSVVNRTLQADFDPSRFDYVARWRPNERYIEMGLRSTCDQNVCVGALGTSFGFRDGEELRTEISTKFDRDGVERELEAAGFTLEHWWTDPAGEFALSLASPFPRR